MLLSSLSRPFPNIQLHTIRVLCIQQAGLAGKQHLQAQLQTAPRENQLDVALILLRLSFAVTVCMNGASNRSHTAVMAPSSGLQTSIATTSKRSDYPPSPPFARSATAPGPLRTLAKAPSDRSRLAPEDAFFAAGPSRRVNAFDSSASGSNELLSRHLRMRSKDTGSRSRSRRRKRAWKKLLWVKQSCRPFDTCTMIMYGNI